MKNIFGLLIAAAVALIIFLIIKGSALPLAVSIIVAIFAGIFVALVFLPADWQAWLHNTFSSVPVIVIGSWLGMALTMGSMGFFMQSMKDDMHQMRADMDHMSGYMQTMSTDIAAMKGYMGDMNDDISQIDDVIHGIDLTLEAEIGPSVRAMAPAVVNMGYSMHRGVDSFSNPMDYMKNAFEPLR